jgi:hypothetical protein
MLYTQPLPAPTLLAVHGDQVWPAGGGYEYKAQPLAGTSQLDVAAPVDCLNLHALQRCRQRLVRRCPLVEQLQRGVAEQQLQPFLLASLQHAGQHRQALGAEAGDDDGGEGGGGTSAGQLAHEINVKHFVGHINQHLVCTRRVLLRTGGVGGPETP